MFCCPPPIIQACLSKWSIKYPHISIDYGMFHVVFLALVAKEKAVVLCPLVDRIMGVVGIDVKKVSTSMSIRPNKNSQIRFTLTCSNNNPNVNEIIFPISVN